jgi:hypothetical protein
MAAATSTSWPASMAGMVSGLKVTFQSVGEAAVSLTSRAGAVPSFFRVKVKARSLPAVASPDRRPSGPASDSLGWPVTSSMRPVVPLISALPIRAATSYWPAAMSSGGLTLSVTSFDSSALTGMLVSSWVPYCSLKVTWKPAGASATRLKT